MYSTRNKTALSHPLSTTENLSSTSPSNMEKVKRKGKNVGPSTKRIKKEKGQENQSKSVLSSNKADIKTVQFKGLVPVDDECKECLANYHVYASGNNIYNAMLNQTNVGQNNNKYYLLQILKHNKASDYCVWFRWGRVGKIAGTNLQHLPLDAAIKVFEKKFKDKTNNLWENRSVFTKFPQKYDLLQIDYGKEKEKTKPKKLTKAIPSKLHKKVQEVMSMLFDISEFERSVKEMQYDVNKAPLGKLTETQLKFGYASLKVIEECIQKGNFGRKLQDACSEFYTRIPHDFGMKRPPIIQTETEIQSKVQLLEALSDIKVAISIIDDTERQQGQENSMDLHYKSLNCLLSPVSDKAQEFSVIQQYLVNTHAPTHSNYKLKLEHLFELKKTDLEEKFLKKLDNRVLLWHGSRLTNWCGILKQGLRIAPPEAPTTGWMYGKGVYFADMVSKSANYCFATPRHPFGFLLLCEVALGSMDEKFIADSEAHNLPKGKHSVKGLGRTVPNPDETIILEDGTAVPIGKPTTMSAEQNYTLLYNEYVVYNVNQIRPRYLVKVKFQFSTSW